MPPVFLQILLAVCVSSLVTLAIVWPVIALARRIANTLGECAQGDRLLFEKVSNPATYSFEDWPNVFARTAHVSGDTLELNTATRAFSTAQGKLETAGIPHVHQIFHITADSVEGVRRILDESGAIQLQMMAKSYGGDSPAGTLPATGGLYCTVKLFVIRVPVAFKRQAEEALGDPVREAKDALLRPGTQGS